MGGKMRQGHQYGGARKNDHGMEHSIHQQDKTTVFLGGSALKMAKPIERNGKLSWQCKREKDY